MFISKPYACFFFPSFRHRFVSLLMLLLFASFKAAQKQARRRRIVTHCAANPASVVVGADQPFADDTLQCAHQLLSLHAPPQAPAPDNPCLLPLPSSTYLLHSVSVSLCFTIQHISFSPLDTDIHSGSVWICRQVDKWATQMDAVDTDCIHLTCYILDILGYLIVFAYTTSYHN